MFDLHSHILPGMDDGPGDLEQSLEMCRIAVKDGIRGIVATPHHANGVYTTLRNDVFEAVVKLNQALEREHLNLTVYPGTEVHFHAGLSEKIQKGEICTYVDAYKHVLIELPTQIIPPGIQDEIFQLRLAGITPIIAHPERNMAVQEDIGVLSALVTMGALCQITAQSVLGRFGSQAEKTSHKLLHARLAHCIATDAHSPHSRPPKLSAAMEVVETVLNNDPAFLAYVQNLPALVAQGHNVPEPPECDESIFSSSPSLWNRLQSWLR